MMNKSDRCDRSRRC